MRARGLQLWHVSLLMLFFTSFILEAKHLELNNPTFNYPAIDSVKKVIANGGDADKMALAYSSLAYYYRNMKPDQLSFSCIKQVVGYIPKISTTAKPDIYLNIATTYIEKALFDQSLLFAHAAAIAAGIVNDTARKREAYHGIANVYSYSGEPQKAIIYYYKAIHEHEKFGKGKPLGTMLALAGLCYDIGENRKAIEICDEIKPLIDTLNYEKMARLNETYGSAYIVLEQYTLGIDYLYRALFYKKAINDLPGEAFVIGTIAGAYYRMCLSTNNPEYFKNALQLYQSQLTLAEQNNIPLYFVAANLGLGELYLSQKRYQQCLQYSLVALKHAQIHAIRDGEKRAFEILYQTYNNLGYQEQAFQSLYSYIKLKDSIASQAAERKLLEEELKLDYEKKTAIAQAEFEQKALLSRSEQKLQIVTRNAIIITLIFASLLLFTLAALNHQRKLKQNHQAFTQRLISLQEEERKAISKELHDGIGQNLLVIGQQLNDSQGLIATTLGELRQIARNLHPVLLEKLGFKKAVESIIQETETATGIFFSHDIEEPGEQLSDEKLINLYRIVQECLSNIMKHAHAKNARITFSNAGKFYALKIEDDGIGFDLEEAQKKKSMGLISLQERVAIINGSLDINSTSEGTQISIRIAHG